MNNSSSFAKQISRRISKLAGKKDVLIIGEQGTGKRHLAHEIHQARSRKGQYIVLDGLSTELSEVQAVFFGRNRDQVRSTTGHDAAKLSDNATLCIANVDAFGPFEQNQIGGFLGQGRKEYSGIMVILTASDETEVSLDIAAFETVEVPALRDRPEDIPELAKSILHDLGRETLAIGDSELRVLAKSSWPGNIAELAAVVGKGTLISTGDSLQLPGEFLNEQQHLQDAVEHIAASKPFDLDRTLWVIEKLLIERLLHVTRNNQSRAAVGMGLSEANFRYRLKKFGIKSVRAPK